jgi:hypothetical protein
MAESIRRVVREDLAEISNLYDGRKSVKELAWLFVDPANEERFNAFVAINEKDQIIGVIGYVLSTYFHSNKQIEGVIPISWKISNTHQGFAGVMLFKKVLEQGQFAIAIEGSEIAQKLYPLFKYKLVSKSSVYYKILNRSKFYKSINKRGILRRLALFSLLLPSSFYRSSLIWNDNSHIEFVPFDGETVVNGENYPKVFCKQVDKESVNWLIACPNLDSYAFNMIINKTSLGICVMYIQAVQGVRRGRIVYLPFLGYDYSIWVGVLDECIRFFKKHKCSLVSVLAHHKACHSGLKKAGFIPRHIKPIFLKDKNRSLDAVDMENWHIQYNEGDKAYRDIHFV